MVQQLREAFPEAGRYRYAIFDRDSRHDADVIAFLKATGLKAKRTSVQAPWQNGVAERWVGSLEASGQGVIDFSEKFVLLRRFAGRGGSIYERYVAAFRLLGSQSYGKLTVAQFPEWYLIIRELL